MLFKGLEQMEDMLARMLTAHFFSHAILEGPFSGEAAP